MNRVLRCRSGTRVGFVGVAVLMSIGLAACTEATQGPTILIDETGWTANPQSVVQSSDRFSFDLDNSLDTDVEFVLLRMDYGDVVDIPLEDGLVDVSQQVVYDGDDPVVAYVPYPEVGDGADWEPWSVDAGSSTRVNVGTSLGGGEPGRFAVISYRPGAIDAGEYAVFEMTDENGEVPQFTLEDFFPPEGE